MIELNFIFTFMYFFKSKYLYNDITKYEINVEIQAAYSPINLINIRFVNIFIIAEIIVVYAISFFFFSATYIPPIKFIIIFQIMRRIQ